MRWCITLAIILLAQVGFADIDLVQVEFFEKSVRPLDHWAFRARTRPSPPAVKDPSWPHNPVDNFILAKLERNQLAPSPRADKRTLLRRACFDLTGLPPTIEQIRRFMADDAADAFGKLVDRLLASPEYGRRWGRHWLDLARYADTSGDGTDMPVPQAGRYRDYVIDAFNEDLPFNEFIIEQIAGDILAWEDPNTRYRERIIASGYVALARRFKNSKNADPHLIIENTLDTIGKGMLGITLSCARCHDHKFDPITTADYYQLYGFFQGVRYPHAGTEHGREPADLVPLVRDPAEVEQYNLLSRERSDLDRQLKEIRDVRKNPTLKRLRELREEEKDLRKENERDEGQGRNIEARQLALNELKGQADEVEEAYSQQRGDLEERLRELRGTLDIELAWAVLDVEDKTGDAKIQIGGNPGNRGKTVARGFIDCITPEKPVIPERESGRVQLAQWIASPDNPLTARVMANRIWQYHFHRGIVSTSSVLGSQGKRPTHPELLDWLANRFVEGGWSIKAMHRLIMNSATWQMASVLSPDQASVGGAMALLQRYPSHRLDAESIRDAILAVSGTLDLAPLESHPFPSSERRRGITQHRPFFEDYDHHHRTVYLMRRRLGNHPFLTLFDGPNPNQTTAFRAASTVPQQALFMMNSAFMGDNATALAKRLLAGDAPLKQRLELAYELAYARLPDEQELTRAKTYLDTYQAKLSPSNGAGQKRLRAWASLSKIILSSNEFIYVD